MTETATCTRCGQEFDDAENGCPVCGRLRQATTCSRHPAQTAEGQCILCGTPVCDECNAGDSHFACPTHAGVPIFEGWAQVYTTSDEIDAQLIRENLVAEGIDAEILSQRDQTFLVELGDLAPVRVLVPAFDYLAAQELMSGHMDETGEVAFACEACGEAYDPGQTVCVSCQAPIPHSA